MRKYLLFFALLICIGGMAQPTIASFSPASGAAGSSVVITGTNFSATASDNIVYFGAVRAVITTASSTSLTVIVPQGSSFAPISVTNNGLTCYSQKFFILTFVSIYNNVTLNSAFFSSRVNVPVGIFPFDIKVCDFDNDKKADIVVANSSDSSISILRNISALGSVSFATTITKFTLGKNAGSVATGDLNGDGKPDIAVTNNNNISIYANISTPGTIDFATRIDITYPTSLWGISVSDIDGDGKPDIISASIDQLIVYKNTTTAGNISFAAPVFFATANDVLALCIDDFSGDGKPDIAVSCQTAGVVSFFKNTSTPGSISFHSKQDVSIPAGVEGINSGDFDNNGLPDVLVINHSTSSFSIVANNSIGNNIDMSLISTTSLSDESFQASVGDINGDGKIDLSISTGNLSIFRNTGAGFGFSPKQGYPIDPGHMASAINDIDGDGIPDLISLGDAVTNTISVLRNRMHDVKLLSFSPSTALSADTIKITGNGFTGVLTPTIGGNPVTSYTIISDSSMNVVVGTFTGNSKIAASGPCNSDTIGILYKTGFPQVKNFTTSAGNNASILVRGKNFTNTTAITFGGVSAKSFTVTSDTSIRAVIGTGGTGYVKVTTPSGVDSLDGFHFLPTPSIKSFLPTSGRTGDTVTIKGKNLGNISLVQFGDYIASSVNALNDSTVKAVIGGGSSGKITVVGTGGLDTLSGFTYLPPAPIIVSFTPLSAKTGTTVIVTGTNFSGTTAVSFGGTAAASFTVLSSTTLSAVVAGGSTGSISITTVGGTAALSGFTYTNPPIIANVTPLSAITGSSIIITGSNFNATAGSNIVFFGAIRATVTASSTDKLTVTVPPGATYGTVTVLNAATYLSATSDANFIPIFNPANSSISATDFADKTDISTSGNNPTNVLTGDLDGDGKADMVVINSDNSSLAFFLNTSTGNTISFATPIIFSSLTNPFAGSLGDLDGDGKPDLAVTELNSNNINVLLNKSTIGNIVMGPATYGNGSLIGNIVVGTGSRPIAVAIADIDGDGKQDLSVTNTNSNTISIYRNTGTPGGQLSFATGVDLVSGSVIGPFIIQVADIDKDGKPDIAVGYQFANTNIAIFRNTSTIGAISFASRIDIAAGATPWGLTLGDLDGDGKPDLAVANYTSNTFSFFRNTSIAGSISFSVKTDIATNNPSYTFAIADIDGDGKADLSFANYTANTLSIFKNTSTVGGIAFSASTTLSSASFPGSVTAADFNNDGKPDLVVANRLPGGNNISIFRNQMSAQLAVISFTPVAAKAGASIVVTGKNLSGVTAITLGGTAVASFTIQSSSTLTAVVATGSTGSLSVSTGGATAALSGFTFIAPTPAIPVITNISPLSGAIGSTVTIKGKNFSGDKGKNIVYFGAVKATVNSASDSVLIVTVPPGANFQPLNVTVNGLTAYAANSFNVTFSGAGTALTLPYNILNFTLNGYTYGIKAADFDGDGKTDIVLSNFDSNYVAVYRNNSLDSNFTLSSKVILPVGIHPFRVTVADIDGDGKPDILVPNASVTSSTGSVSVIRNTSSSGNISFAQGIEFTTDLSASDVMVNDFDGDGKPDMVVTTTNNLMNVLRNTSTNGVLSFSKKQFTITTYQYNAVGVCVGDADGDGKPDLFMSINDSSIAKGFIAVYRNTSTEGNISFNTTQTLATNAMSWGLTLGDLNGDGKPELLAANHGGNFVSVFKNTSTAGTISFDTKMDLPTNTTLNTAAIGDLDGDGKPDIVAGASTTAQLNLIKNTSASGGGTLSFAPKTEFGIGTGGAYDIITGEFDGDGKTDIIFTSFRTFTLLQSKGTKPHIIGLSRYDGSVGTYVAINGTGLNGVNKVKFGGIDAGSFIVASDNSIIAYVGAGSSGYVSVSNTLGSDSVPDFKFVGPVKIKSFSPTTAGTGSTVTIKGSNFVNPSYVKFGGISSTVFTWVSDSVLTAVVGKGNSGYVTVGTPTGIDSLDGFTVGAPKITVPGDAISFGTTVNVAKIDSYLISAQYLQEALVITTPANFLVSTSAGTGFVSSLSITPVNGQIASTKIYVRFLSATTGSFTGNITHVSANATTQNVAVNGSTLCDAVSNQTASFNGINADTSICFKNSITLTADGNYSLYRWSTGATTKTLTINASDNIILQVGSTAGCLSNPSLPVKLILNANPVPTLALSGDTRLISSSAANYRWYFNNSLVPNQSSSIYDATRVGFYKVETSFDKTCWDASNEFPILFVTTPLVNDSISIKAFPNPSSGTFNVVATLQRVTNVVAKVTVTDVAGNTLLQTNKFIFFGKEIKIPVTVTVKGTVFVKLDVNGDVKTISVIIQ